MKNNVLYLLTLVFTLSLSVQAQRGGLKIGYIDTEYILENIPEYQQASEQLNTKANKWKVEIDEKLNAVAQKRNSLNSEKPLLTKELIEEREEDIMFEENEILDYQQKRFGPNGDLFIQKKQLMQPIQDQIFAAVQDLATTRQYDFIFDKASSNALMLYSKSQYDLSEVIIRSITKTAKRTQAQNKAERKAAENEELLPEINTEKEEREKAIETKKAERQAAAEKRRQDILDAREAKRQELEAKRQRLIEKREEERQELLDARVKTETQTKSTTNTEKTTKQDTKEETGKTRAELIEEKRKERLAEMEARRQALIKKREKLLEERQRAKDSINNLRNN